ncbi:Mss4-like protein [Chytriomyces sp. MP71]|nr:Mss4-like protein [Chytriomyces sp. MP71]
MVDEEALKATLVCAVPGCSCVFLKTGAATLDAQFKLDPPASFPPLPTATDKTPTGSASLASLWRVADMMRFENIAFSHVLSDSGHRMLACADCEAGPIGFQPKGEKMCFIIPDRVKVREQ